MRKLLSTLIVLALTACNATGPKYTGQEQGNLTVYRPSHILYGASYYSIDIDMQPTCNLGNGGFFTRQISEPVVVSADKFMLPGTSRIKVKPGSYVRVEAKHDRMFAPAIGGAILGAGLEGIDSEAGPYTLTLVKESIAKDELKDLQQDCI